MFLSSSFIIVKVKNKIDIENILKDFHFTQEKKELEDYAFYSMDFYDEEKTMGEIHWSESFNYGKMNMINFIRKNENFILFTSAVQNFKVLSNILNCLAGIQLETEVIKLPLNFNIEELRIKEITSVESKSIFGTSIFLSIQGKYILLKIYTNGLITYSMTNERGIIERIIDIVLELMSLKVGDDS
ncbi:hypothetical protein [Bacillus safensis]|uniref:hypothetical protein n=1 Tax=Bacillus safensis TaxID=561879 RepID=UPI00040C79F9|nr:hypothetical protein [Bacillus safensis]